MHEPQPGMCYAHPGSGLRTNLASFGVTVLQVSHGDVQYIAVLHGRNSNN